jgi:fatty-acyl-CoA synthase
VLDSLPLTAVGKVFKPALRARAAATALSAKLAVSGLRAAISVENDPQRGLVAHVRAAASLRAEVATALARFPIIVEITGMDEHEPVEAP